jgi:hypothetical protein
MIRGMRSALLAYLLLASAAGARDLRWRELAVQAELRNDGSLRVSETHAIVFTGDWIGGERTFRVEPHETFTLHGMRRGSRPLAAGDLKATDQYRLFEGPTLRWRARMPSDPPFASQEIAYTIDYTVGNVLVPDVLGNGYVLEHDFAFADRDGPIERFSLAVTLDSAWTSSEGRGLRRSATQIPPGQSFELSAPLTFRGANRPESMSRLFALGLKLRPWLVPATMFSALALFHFRERFFTRRVRSAGGLLVLAGLLGGIVAAAMQPHEILVLFLILFGGLGVGIFGVTAKSRTVLVVIPILVTLLTLAAGRMFLPLGAMTAEFSLYAILSLTAAWLGVYLIVLAAAARRSVA